MDPVGLDPRLEASGLWPDFHTLFIGALREHLTATLQPRYAALTEERVYLAWDIPPAHVYRPDATVVAHKSDTPPAQGAATQPVALAVPVLGTLPIQDEVHEWYVVLRSLEGQVVAVVELLSPGNKQSSGAGREAYLKKRDEFLRSRVHLVEIDLLKEGVRPPLASSWPEGDYVVSVARGDRRPVVELYPFNSGEALPAIRLPLLAPDPDFALDLQAILAETWRRGRYDLLLQRLRRER
ncbi:MAG TPA: DUF4058 family protein [Limnochordia bacterium]|nr:DUF4058 family protein [Limnochordia bacterium]